MRGLRVVPLFALAAIALLVGACAPPPSPAVAKLAYASDHGCVLISNSTTPVKCWGGNNNYDLPIDSAHFSEPTTAAPLLGGAVQISGYCAVMRGGGVKCWGPNNYGQLGIGTAGAAVGTPVDVVGITNATQVSSTAGTHACAVVGTGSVKCWGVNYTGALGNGAPGLYSPVPVDVVGLTDAVQVVDGNLHTCALRATGSVVCWGWQVTGSLGNGIDEAAIQAAAHSDPPVTIPDYVAQPVPVDLITTATKIAAGSRFSTCAVLSGGMVQCWGENNEAQLGAGFISDDIPSPTTVVGVAGATDVALGVYHGCATVTGGGVKCWGDNYYGEAGQVANQGTATPILTPSPVAGLSGVKTLAAGDEHSCAIVGSGVKCWGYNWNTALGNTNAGGPVPFAVMNVP